jgi:hypothetical protein
LRCALIIANHFLETDLEKLRAAVSTGYARGKWSLRRLRLTHGARIQTSHSSRLHFTRTSRLNCVTKQVFIFGTDKCPNTV